MPNPARPRRAAEVAPHGWVRDARLPDGTPDPDAPAIDPADAPIVDRAAARRMSGLPAGWALPHGSLVVRVDDARGAIAVRPAPAPR